MLLREKAQKILNQAESMNKLHDFLVRLDSELATMLDELNEATEENAVEVCRSVAERLDAYYQEL